MSDLPAWCQMLIELRGRRGWGRLAQARILRQLAESLCIDQVAATTEESIKKAVLRWETQAVVPSAPYQVLLACSFATHHGRATIGPGSEFERFFEVLDAMGVPVSRREALRTFALGAAGGVGGTLLLTHFPLEMEAKLAAALRNPDTVDLETIASLRRAVTKLRASSAELSLAGLHAALTPHLHALDQLVKGSQPEAVQQPLWEAATEANAFAGWLYFELHDRHSAEARFREADRLGRGLRNQWPAAFAAVNHALLCLYDGRDLARGLALARRATEYGLHGDSRCVLAYAAAVQGELYAASGEAKKAMKSIDLAGCHLAGVQPGDPFGDSFNQARLVGFRGICHLRLRQADAAAAELQRSLDDLVRLGQAVRGTTVADLARARLWQGEPEEAARLLAQAVPLIASKRRRAGVQRVYELYPEFGPWMHEPFMKEPSEKLQSAGLL